ncbi:retrovirus-related pol polyprotein from transposon TNT 1-94 [Tanacetum coccineum]
MTTLVEFMIIAGVDNHPPMLEKSMYDSWKSRMELYIENRENGRMILNSVLNVLLVWPTIVEENGLPLDVYAIVNHHKVAKEIWDRVKLLMQGTKLSLQERECKLYDEFDKFSFVKGETLYRYYWRFAQLINNMSNINMSMRPVQVNTKFLNSLLSEWSKLVMDVKLARDLHTTNYDQLYSYLEQHEAHENETRLMREQYQDPLAFVANFNQPPPPFKTARLLCNKFKGGKDKVILVLAIRVMLLVLREIMQEDKQGLLNVIIFKVKDTWLGNALSLRGQGTLHCLRKRQCWLNHRNLTEDLDAYDSDCDDVSTAQAVLMANISNYGSDVISEKAQRIKPTLYDGSVISSQHVVIPVIDDEETLILEEDLENSKDKSCNNQNALEILEYFENNDLKAQLQAKDTTIHNLKEHIKSMRENDKEEKVKQEMDEIETINIELEHSVAKLLSENELLHKEIEHLKKIYKDQFDSIKKTRALSKEHCDSLIAQLNSKSMENADLKGMFKLDIDTIYHRLKNNRDAHEDYLKKTIENIDTIRGFVERARKQNPSESLLDSACKFTKHVQELLVYVSQTCPSFTKPSKKLVFVTPMNKVKKVRFSEPLTSSSNIHKQVDSSKIPYSNTSVLPSTRLKISTSASRSQPTSNRKNDRIWQTPSNNMKNNVKDHPRNIKSKSNKKNRVKDPICDANVKHTMLNVISELICVKCKQCMIDANHDVCFLDFVNDVNVRSISKSAKQSQQHNIWKPTGKVFIEVGYKWKPTGKLFYFGWSKKSKIIESRIANNSEPNHYWESNAINVPSSSSLINDRLSRLFFANDITPQSIYVPKASRLRMWLLAKKSKKSSHQPKAEDTNQEKLYLLHMDLCGPMRVESINGKKSKDEAPDAIIKYIKNIQVHLNATVCNVRIDNGTEFVNQTLRDFYENVGISHQTSVAHTPKKMALSKDETEL